MTDLNTFLDNNRKSDSCRGGKIHGIYLYLEMIGEPTTLTTSGQLSRHFSPSSSITNDTEYLQPVIADLRKRQKSICEFCISIGHKYDACIIRGPKFLLPSLISKINSFTSWSSYKNNPLTPKHIGEGLKVLHTQLWKEALFVQFEKNKHFRLLSVPIPIKSPPKGTTVLCSLIDTSIKEHYCYYAWKCVTLHC